MNIHTRVALTSTVLAVCCALAFVAQWLWSNDRYHQEVTQRLHAGLAQYIVEHLSEPLFTKANKDGQAQVNHPVLKSIAMNTMMINPSVEVYLLDLEGRVLGHALPEQEVEAGQVDVAPIISLLEGRKSGAVRGENPRDRSVRSIFSTTPVQHEGQHVGYLYVLLGSHQQQTIASTLEASHAFRVGLVALGAIALLFALLAWIAFQKLTSPLRRLASEARNYRLENFQAAEARSYRVKDEVEELRHSMRLMQQRIQEQFDRLMESEQHRRELVSNVSHDLRTPLTAIQGYLETLLSEEERDEATHREYLKIAHRHCCYLGTLIEELFELSRLDAGQVEPDYERFSITELMHDVCADYRIRARSKQVTIDLDAPEAPLTVRADIALIQRVLQNLLDNALKHTPAGGVVKLIVRKNNGQVKLDIADSGSGIRTADLPYVFDRYFQSLSHAGDTMHGANGSGLGLSIVRKILALHDASIQVRSKPNEGTQFQFALRLV